MILFSKILQAPVTGNQTLLSLAKTLVADPVVSAGPISFCSITSNDGLVRRVYMTNIVVHSMAILLNVLMEILIPAMQTQRPS